MGWVIVGEVCLGRAHKPEFVNVYWCNVLSNGRISLFDPCTSSLHIKEKLDTPVQHRQFPGANASENLFDGKDSLGEGIFQQTPHGKQVLYRSVS